MSSESIWSLGSDLVRRDGAWTSGAVSFSYCGSSSVLLSVQVGADCIFNRRRVTDEACVFVGL